MTMKENPKTLKSIRGMTVAITGTCWIGRTALIRKIRKSGGFVTNGSIVNDLTDILVRGSSSRWKYKTHGRKEAKVADLIKKGKALVVIPDYEFQKLVLQNSPARVADTIAGQPIEWLIPSSKKTLEKTSRFSGSLDREHTTLGRLEQGFLRQNMFKGNTCAICAICAREFPIELLVAAHIKPRSECSMTEKRDADHIVFPLCLFGCDALYERGIISIDTKGCVTVSKTLELTKSVEKYLKNIKGNKCISLGERNTNYFRWHHERRFRP